MMPSLESEVSPQSLDVLESVPLLSEDELCLALSLSLQRLVPPDDGTITNFSSKMFLTLGDETRGETSGNTQMASFFPSEIFQ